MGTATVVAAPTTKVFNVLTGRITDPHPSTTSWSSSNPDTFANRARCLLFINPRPRPGCVSVARCSTKPDAGTDNAVDRNSVAEPNPSSNSTQPAKPSSPIESLSSSPSSSSSSSSSQISQSTPSSFHAGKVFDLSPANSWDGAEVGSPVVKRFLSDEEERWYMWYHGRSAGSESGFSDSIGLAVSSNGVHWERGGTRVQSSADVGLVLNCSKDWWAFDTLGVRPSEVAIMSSKKVRASSAVYWLYYTGYSSERVIANTPNGPREFPLRNPETALPEDASDGNGKPFKSLPGLAISQDGRHWARIEGEHHSGALLDVGSDGTWDSTFIGAPRVVWHGNGDLRMYYHSFDVENGHFAIGIARSRDGIRWVKLGKIMGRGLRGCFDELGVMNAHVVRSPKHDKYVMVYEGVAVDGRRSIGLAESLDGLKNWRRLQDGAILRPSRQGGWDCEGAGSPYLVQMSGNADEWRLYYRGIGSHGKTGIGMAVSEGGEIGSFRRWTGIGFHF